MLQLHPNFYMKALEVLVTLEVVDEAVDKVKEKVAATRRTAGTSREGTTAETWVSVEAPKVVKIKDVN